MRLEEVDNVVVSDSWNSSKKPIKKITRKTWNKIYARWGWTCELATSAQNPFGSRVRSSELIVGMVTGLEGELYISYYHPATSQELTILAKHFGSPLVLQEEAGRIVKIRYPERLVRKSAGTAELRGGITLGVSPSEELDFDAPSEGVWPIGPFGMCLDRYIDRRGQKDYFRKGVEEVVDYGGDEHP